MLRFTLFLIALIFFAPSVSAQHFLSTSGQDIVNEAGDPVLLRGMGLGGWMLQEGYMLQTAGFAGAQYQIRAGIEELIGEEDTELFYQTWRDNHVTKADIDALKAWGFNSVRLPMHYNLYTLPIQDEPVVGEHTWLDEGFIRTDSLISWCKQNEMYVILDLHATPGGQGMDAAISDYNPALPSLWESQANREKAVALWRKLAERYVDEQWVAGYDLINETNWNLPGGTMLRNIYEDMTSAIRAVDTEHIIFIEGNWFANDFTGLTPPWDDNLVYSPHKYWSTNDQESIQWVLNLRKQYNVPLYLGESGENSNVWFRDAIKLLEENNIGWAWWPMKKVESIAGPLSVVKKTGYQTLLDYWENDGPQPSAAVAKAALMELAEDLKIEHCKFQFDVIDAMFRQVENDTSIPYNTQDIPGTLFASDYDLGRNGLAYFDTQDATYQVSTGSFTAWNNGWFYRNDGVDMEPCQDTEDNNGVNVGWLDEGEWMEYDVNVSESGLYEATVRYASGAEGGAFHFSVGDAQISETVAVGGTGAWQTWADHTVSNIVLQISDNKIRYNVDQSGLNLSKFTFNFLGPSTSVDLNFVAGSTVNEQMIQFNLNKPLADEAIIDANDFIFFVNGGTEQIVSLEIDESNRRNIFLTTSASLEGEAGLTLSYFSNSGLFAADGTELQAFSFETIANKIPKGHPIPGRIEAEDFSEMSGIQLENCEDIGGGQNIGFLDVGDTFNYEILVAGTDNYSLAIRHAAEFGDGSLEIQLWNESTESYETIRNVSMVPTGGWQTWQSFQTNLILTEGKHDLRFLVSGAPLNINWFEFSLGTGIDFSPFEYVQAYPNPAQASLVVHAKTQENESFTLRFYDMQGQIVEERKLNQGAESIHEVVDLRALSPGQYLLSLEQEGKVLHQEKIVHF